MAKSGGGAGRGNGHSGSYRDYRGRGGKRDRVYSVTEPSGNTSVFNSKGRLITTILGTFTTSSTTMSGGGSRNVSYQGKSKTTARGARQRIPKD